MKIDTPSADVIRKLSDRICNAGCGKTITQNQMLAIDAVEMRAIIWAAMLIDDQNVKYQVVDRYKAVENI